MMSLNTSKEFVKCPIHGCELSLFCKAHYAMCCPGCHTNQESPHNECPVVPFDEEGNLKIIHDNLATDLTLLTAKAEKLIPTATSMIRKQEGIAKNIAIVKAEIQTEFNKIRDTLNSREEALIKEVEMISEGMDMSSLISKINDAEEEIKKAITAGQETLRLMKKEDKGNNLMSLCEMVRRGCTVMGTLEHVKELEIEANKALKSIPKVAFENNNKDAGVITWAADIGKIRIIRRCPQNVVAISQGWDNIELKWDPYREDEGKNCVYEVEMKKDGEEDSSYKKAYEGEEENCTVSGLLCGTVYCFRVCANSSAGSDSKEWSDEAKTGTQKIPAPEGLMAKVKSWDMANLKWEPISATGLSYRVKAKATRGPEEMTVECGQNAQCIMRMLKPNTEYKFSVQAGQGGSWGEWSKEVKGTTRSAPSKLSGNAKWKNFPSCSNESYRYSFPRSLWPGNIGRTAQKYNNGSLSTVVCDTTLSRYGTVMWYLFVDSSRSTWNCVNIYVGVAPYCISQVENRNYEKCGWYFYCRNSSLWSGPPHNYKGNKYGSIRVCARDRIGVVMDTTRGELSFIFKNENLGIAYKGIPLDKPLVPCALLERNGDSVTFCIS